MYQRTMLCLTYYKCLHELSELILSIEMSIKKYNNIILHDLLTNNPLFNKDIYFISYLYKNVQ